MSQNELGIYLAAPITPTVKKIIIVNCSVTFIGDNVICGAALRITYAAKSMYKLESRLGKYYFLIVCHLEINK